MKMIKEGVAKNIPEKLIPEYKKEGWKEVKPAKPSKPGKDAKNDKPKEDGKSEEPGKDADGE